MWQKRNNCFDEETKRLKIGAQTAHMPPPTRNSFSFANRSSSWMVKVMITTTSSSPSFVVRRRHQNRVNITSFVIIWKALGSFQASLMTTKCCRIQNVRRNHGTIWDVYHVCMRCWTKSNHKLPPPSLSYAVVLRSLCLMLAKLCEMFASLVKSTLIKNA